MRSLRAPLLGLLCGSLLSLVAYGVPLSAQTSVLPSTAVEWAQPAASLALAQAARVRAYANTNADLVIANVNDGTAVGTLLTTSCTGASSPFSCTATLDIQTLLGTTTSGLYTVAVVYEPSLGGGSYGAKVLVAGCDVYLAGAPPPPTAEICGDQLDNDGDGLVDEGCTPPPPPPGATGTVSATPNPCTITSGNTTCSADITWSATFSTGTSALYVRVDTGTPILFACGASGTTPAAWIGTAGQYVFSLHAAPTCSPTMPTTTPLASVSVTSTVAAPPTPPIVGLPAGAVVIAQENETVSLVGTQIVYYGASGAFFSGSFTGSVACTNGTFGDPIDGTVKACYTVVVAPPVINCVVSDFGDWSAWIPYSASEEQRTRLRTITTSPSGGGTTCPALSESETRTIVVAPLPDTTAPTISLTAPAASAVVSGQILLSATAADNIAIASVQFLVDSVNHSVPDTLAPYEVAWNTVPLADGSHTIQALALDTAGNSTLLTARTVTVDNIIDGPPVPPAQSVITTTVAIRTCTLTLSANQTPDGTLGWTVRFRRNGLSHGSRDSSAPYTQSAQVNVGTYILTAEWTKGQTISRITVGTYTCPAP